MEDVVMDAEAIGGGVAVPLNRVEAELIGNSI